MILRRYEASSLRGLSTTRRTISPDSNPRRGVESPRAGYGGGSDWGWIRRALDELGTKAILGRRRNSTGSPPPGKATSPRDRTTPLTSPNYSRSSMSKRGRKRIALALTGPGAHAKCLTSAHPCPCQSRRAIARCAVPVLHGDLRVRSVRAVRRGGPHRNPPRRDWLEGAWALPASNRKGPFQGLRRSRDPKLGGNQGHSAHGLAQD